MSNSPNEAAICTWCGIRLEPEEYHSDKDGCIKGLRAAMLKQRKAAELLSFEVSTRYLAALEELALRPDVGVPYHMRVPGHPEDIVQLAHQQVAGVFTAIVRKYKELGDWSPLKERDERIGRLERLLEQVLGLLPVLLTPQVLVEINRDHLDSLKKMGQLATQLGVPLPDLRDY